MADERAKARASQSDPGREVKDEERGFSLEELMEGSHGLLDTSPHAVAGALHGTSRKTHTLAQAQRAVDQFLKREVVTE